MSLTQVDYVIYTDGSFLPKSGKGSWAFVMTANDGGRIAKSGTAQKTTSNRMEFQAAIEALKLVPLGASAAIYSDSRNLVDTMTLWMPAFKASAWKKKSGRPVPDTDLLLQLDALAIERSILWKWIKAHSGHTLNEMCDALCAQALGRSA